MIDRNELYFQFESRLASRMRREGWTKIGVYSTPFPPFNIVQATDPFGNEYREPMKRSVWWHFNGFLFDFECRCAQNGIDFEYRKTAPVLEEFLPQQDWQKGSSPRLLKG